MLKIKFNIIKTINMENVKAILEALTSGRFGVAFKLLTGDIRFNIDGMASCIRDFDNEVVEFYIESGRKLYDSALLHAIRVNNNYIAKLLLQKKYQIDEYDIIAAANMKNEELLELLIKFDAKAGEYALQTVISRDNIESAKLLTRIMD